MQMMKPWNSGAHLSVRSWFGRGEPAPDESRGRTVTAKSTRSSRRQLSRPWNERKKQFWMTSMDGQVCVGGGFLQEQLPCGSATFSRNENSNFVVVVVWGNFPRKIFEIHKTQLDGMDLAERLTIRGACPHVTSSSLVVTWPWQVPPNWINLSRLYSITSTCWTEKLTYNFEFCRCVSKPFYFIFRANLLFRVRGTWRCSPRGLSTQLKLQGFPPSTGQVVRLSCQLTFYVMFPPQHRWNASFY